MTLTASLLGLVAMLGAGLAVTAWQLVRAKRSIAESHKWGRKAAGYYAEADERADLADEKLRQAILNDFIQ